MSLPSLPPLVAPIQNPQPFNVAVIVDGIVYDVMNIDGQHATMFLSNPTFVQVDGTRALTGWHYDGTDFTPPVAP